MNRYFIKTDAILQRRVLDLRTLIGIGIRKLTGCLTERHQHITPFKHLLYRIRAKQIIIDIIQLILVRTLVTLRPFLCITNSTYTSQIDSGNKISRIFLLYQIRERQIGRIRMIDMASHYQRECSHTRRPQDIRV